MKKKKLVITGVAAGVLIVLLIGLGPIIVAKIMRKGSKSMGKSKIIKSPIILEVRVNFSLEQDGILMLTSDYDRRYILTGDKVGELKEKVNKNITVSGKIKYPNPKEIDGNSIRYNITVTAFTDEVPIEKAELSKVRTLTGHAIKVNKTTISGRLEIIKEGIDLYKYPEGKLVLYQGDGELVFLFPGFGFALVEEFIGKKVELAGIVLKNKREYQGGKFKELFIREISDIKLK